MRLIEKVWFNGHVAKWLLVPLLLPFSALFGVISYLRRLAYKFNLKSSIKPDLPVVVVGNIGVGGNGKTPLTLHLLALCQQMGLKAGVISRGYGGNAPFYPYLLDEQTISDYSGDEPLMIYQRTGVPVVVGADRIKSTMVLKEQGCQLVIADDGLQHYRLCRDSEIIVVDGKRVFGNGLLMPAGPLRELPARLATGNLIIVNGGDKTNGNGVSEEQLNMQLSPTMYININTGEQLSVSNFCQRYSQVNALAAIGDPERFFTTLESASLTLAKRRAFVDHHKFVAQDFVEFTANIPLVMTEKDAVKCHEFAQENWWYLAVSASFNDQDNQQLIDELKRVVVAYNHSDEN